MWRKFYGELDAVKAEHNSYNANSPSFCNKALKNWFGHQHHQCLGEKKGMI